MTLRHYSFLHQRSSLKTSMHLYCDVYVAVQIWRFKELFVLGIVASTINVTSNDISVIYVTAQRCAGGLKKKSDIRSDSQRHRYFVGFFNMPVQASFNG